MSIPQPPDKHAEAGSQLRVSPLCLLLFLLPYGSCTNGNSYELAPHTASFSIPV